MASRSKAGAAAILRVSWMRASLTWDGLASGAGIESKESMEKEDLEVELVVSRKAWGGVHFNQPWAQV
eukprot:747043-Hanusia_phi.AAC.7